MLPDNNYTEYELEELLERRRVQREYMRERRAAKKAADPPSEPTPDYILTPTEAAYIAGFFDGEGIVTIHRDKNKGARGPRVNLQYTMSVRISQSSLGVLEWIKLKCGGSLTESHLKQKGRRHWTIAKKSNSARVLLEKMLPYLIVKKEQAEHAIEFQKLQSAHKNRYEAGRAGPVPRTQDEIAYKEEYFLLLKRLKHQ